MSNREDDLIDRSKDVLCSTHLEIVCNCAGIGNCSGCKIMRLARVWVSVFGSRPCKHIVMTDCVMYNKKFRRCNECYFLEPIDGK